MILSPDISSSSPIVRGGSILRTESSLPASSITRPLSKHLWLISSAIAGSIALKSIPDFLQYDRTSDSYSSNTSNIPVCSLSLCMIAIPLFSPQLSIYPSKGKTAVYQYDKGHVEERHIIYTVPCLAEYNR